MLGSLWRRSAAPPCVSVAVPLYNHAAYIGEAIASILAQGSVVKEVVVIDDGSNDESAAVVSRLAQQDKRIRFSQQENQGAHATINTALARCDGEFLTILNSDDCYLPGRLGTLVTALDNDATADIAVSGVTFMDGDAKPVANAWYEAQLAFYRSGGDLAASLLNGNFVMTTSNLLFRRQTLDSVGAFAALRYVHDLDWLLRALALQHRIVRLDAELLRYRIHDRNTIGEEHGGVRAEWAIAAAAYLTTLWDRPEAPPIDWEHAEAIQAVLRTHLLDRAVGPCMAYLRRHGAAPLDRSPLPADIAFRARVKGWA